MSEVKYPHIFEPIKLGNTLFRNRLFAAPTGIRCMRNDSIYPEEVFKYYRRKAMGGCASVSTGQYMVDSQYGAVYPEQICTDRNKGTNQDVKIPLGKLAYDINRYGAVATMELSHAGMYANRMSGSIHDGRLLNGGVAYGPSEFDQGTRVVREMDEEMIEKIIGQFADAAAFAKACGYGMIMLHAGHGWLFHQFLSPYTNFRKDKWGGSIENRARLLVNTLEACRKAVGPNFPIEVRMSGSERFAGGYDIDEGLQIAKMIDGKCDLIHVSAGNHENKEAFIIIHPTMFIGEGPNVQFAEAIKKVVKTPVATVGALGNPEHMEEILASGKADIIELGRALIADPDLPLKIRTGHEKDINVCLRCLNCFAFQQSHGVKRCAVNPESGHEHETLYNVRQCGTKKKVLVVGGGIGGMEAAITAANNGHEVILCEKSDRLGGVLRCEEKVSFKGQLDRYLNNQEYKVGKNPNIEVRMNTEVTPAIAEEIKPDVIMAALGARARKPELPGVDGANVMSAEEAYVNTDKIGQSVVILGGGLVGMELGLHLSILGHKVTVVEKHEKTKDNGNPLHIVGLNQQIRLRGVETHFNTVAESIDEKGVDCVTANGEKVRYEGETIIYATGYNPLQEEALAFRYCAPEFYMVGDCLTVANIPAATALAHDIAENIGRIL